MKKRIITELMIFILTVTKASAVFADPGFSHPEDYAGMDFTKEAIETNATDVVIDKDEPASVIIPEDRINEKPDETTPVNGTVFTADDGTIYFRAYDDIVPDTVSDSRIDESDINGKFIESLDNLKIIYSSDEAGMLTEEGDWISPVIHDKYLYSKIVYDPETGEYTLEEVYGDGWDLYEHHPEDPDWIAYIKNRLKVDDLNQANPADVDYLIKFVLHHSSWFYCNYVEYLSQTTCKPEHLKDSIHLRLKNQRSGASLP